MQKYFIALLLLLTTITNAQQFNYTTTKEFKVKNHDLGSFIKIGDNYLRYEVDYGPMQFAFTAKLKKVRYGINLYRYDENMKEAQKLSLDDNKDNLGPFVPTFMVFAGHVYIFYYQFQENETVKLLAAQINPATLSINKTVEISTFDQKNVGMSKSVDAIGSTKIYAVASPGEDKVMIVHTTENNIYSFIMDADLKVSHPGVMPVPQLKEFELVSFFVDEHDNKYFSYDYSDKIMRRGIIVDNNKDKPLQKEFEAGTQELGANSLYFASAADSTKLYIYANYYRDHLNEGVLLTVMDKTTFNITKPALFPYPADFIEKLRKLDFAVKQKGNVSVRKTYYSLNQLSGGTVVLSGVPYYSVSGTTSKGYSTFDEFAGPVVNIFISPSGSATFTSIPRDHRHSAANAPRDPLLLTSNDKLICIYTDKPKHLAAGIKDDPLAAKDGEDLVLAAATFDATGNIINRQKLADEPGGNNYFLMTHAKMFDNGTFLIPIGRLRHNLARIFMQFEKLSTLQVK